MDNSNISSQFEDFLNSLKTFIIYQDHTLILQILDSKIRVFKDEISMIHLNVQRNDIVHHPNEPMMNGGIYKVIFSAKHCI